jgi:CheY-like chemotaxis protein
LECVPATVLIVDDDPAFRRAARELLVRAGLTVVAEAGDGAQAHTAFAVHRPDGVLLDVNLPGTTGAVLADQFLVAAPGVRILLTSSDECPDGRHAFVGKLELADCDLAAYLVA